MRLTGRHSRHPPCPPDVSHLRRLSPLHTLPQKIMAVQQRKRPLESEGDESPTTPRTSPHKKRPRAEPKTPDTPPRSSLFSSPGTREERGAAERSSTPTPEKPGEVQRAPLTPEKDREVEDRRTPSTTLKDETEEEHNPPPAPEKKVEVKDAPPTPSRRVRASRCTIYISAMSLKLTTSMHSRANNLICRTQAGRLARLGRV